MRNVVRLVLLAVLGALFTLSVSATPVPATAVLTRPTFTPPTTTFVITSDDVLPSFTSPTLLFCERPMVPGRGLPPISDAPFISMPLELRPIPNASPTPEPASVVLLLSGLLSGAYFLRREK